jgi:hypothetical protein
MEGEYQYLWWFCKKWKFYGRRVSIFLMVLHDSPLILELLYSSPSMITRHYLSCQDRSNVGWDERCAWIAPYRLAFEGSRKVVYPGYRRFLVEGHRLGQSMAPCRL